MVMRAMRENMKVVLWIAIIGFLGTIVFAWGMNFVGGANCQKEYIVMTVNGEDVPYYEYSQLANGFAENQIRRMQQQGMYDSSLEAKIREQASETALEYLKEEYVVLQAARDWGLTATDYEVQETIQSNPYLVDENNQFSEARYQDFLKNFGLTDEDYRATLGRQLLMEKVHSIVYDAVYIPEPAVRAAYLERSQTAEGDFVVVSPADFISRVTVSEAEARKYYDEHQDDFMAPAKAEVDYLALIFDDIYAKIQLTDDDLRAYYEKTKGDAAAAGQINLSHILIPVVNPDDPAAVETARLQAVDLIARLNKGASFEELAAQFSGDPGSAQAGGSLGYISPGQTVPEFEQAAYALAVGQTTAEPVQTQFGWHIIRRNDDIQPYEVMKASLERQLKMDQTMRALNDLQTTLTKLLKEGKSLEEIAKLMPEVRLGHAGPFTEDAIYIDETVRDFRQLRDASFQLELGQISHLLTREAGTADDPDAAFKRDFFVVRPKNITPPAPYTFEEVRAKCEARVLNDKTREAARGFAADLSTQAASLGLEQAVKNAGMTLITAAGVTRNGMIPNVGYAPKAARLLFELPAGQLSGVVEEQDAFYLVRARSVAAPDPVAYGGGLEDLRRQMIDAYKESYYQAWVQTLIAQATIEVKLEELQKQFAESRKARDEAETGKSSDSGGGGGYGGY